MLTIDLNKDVWRCDPIPGPCTTHGRCFLYRDLIVWLGQKDFIGESTRAQSIYVSAYDILLKEWSNFPTAGSPPPDLTGFSGDFMEDRNMFIIFGGEKMPNMFTNDVHLLDVERKKWIQPVVKGKSPEARCWHGTCVHNGVMYCYGGVSEYSRRLSDGVFALHLSTNNVVTWSKPKMLLGEVSPFHLSSFVILPYQGKLILLGGRGDDAGSGLRMYDPKSCKMSRIRPKLGTKHSGYGYGISAIPLRGGDAVAVFGKNGSCKSYDRISAST